MSDSVSCGALGPRTMHMLPREGRAELITGVRGEGARWSRWGRGLRAMHQGDRTLGLSQASGEPCFSEGHGMPVAPSQAMQNSPFNNEPALLGHTLH